MIIYVTAIEMSGHIQWNSHRISVSRPVLSVGRFILFQLHIWSFRPALKDSSRHKVGARSVLAKKKPAARGGFRNVTRGTNDVMILDELEKYDKLHYHYT